MRATVLLLKAAARHGITRAFGIIGGEAQALRFDEVPDIDFYLTRHEFAAGIMADVYGRLSGRPQICYSTFGPGLTNLATGVCSAVLDRSPMLALAAQVPLSERRFNQTHQCIDNAAVMAPMTKYARELEAAEEIPEAVGEALRAARAEVPGPVFLSLPLDVMKREIDDAHADRLLDAMVSSEPAPLPEPEPADMAELARIVRAARQPLALVGNAIIREGECDALRAFVERFQLPVVTTLASKGVIPEDHPLHVGPCNKYLDALLHRPILDRLFGECDLMLLIGYDFGEDVKPRMWQRNANVQTVSLTSVTNPMGEVFQPDREFIGRLGAALPMLTELAPASIERDLSPIAELRNFKLDVSHGHGAISTQIPAVIKALRETLGRDGILCSDIGLHKQYAGLFSETFEPNTFLCSNGCGTFGFGLPAAMAAALACPDRKIAVICGDGGFHSTSQDLETVARYNLPIVIVLLKDNAFGLIKYYQLLDRSPVSPNSVEFGNVDFAALARANGCAGHTVTTFSDLRARMADAFERRVPTLLEVPIQYEYSFAAPAA